MASEKEQVEKQVEKNDNVINIPLGNKQKEIVKRISTEKQKLQEDFNKLTDKEGSVISVLLEAKGIDDSQVENIQLSQDGNSMVVTMKKKEEEKKEEVKKVEEPAKVTQTEAISESEPLSESNSSSMEVTK